MRTLSSRGSAAMAAAMLLAVASVGAAQVPNASPAATGLSGAFIARARGYDAVAWNPANLGLPGNPGFSIGMLALSGSSGLDPISLNDFAPYSDKTLPASQREQWLQKVTAKGGENGTMDGGLTELAMSFGHLAFQVGSSVGGSTKLSPDAFEAVMFGNAGRTGTVENLSLAGSQARVGAFTTGAVSYGFGVASSKDSHMSLGVTAKYTVGHFLAIAQDQGSQTGTNAVTVNMPIVYSNPDSSANVGAGIGVDVGFAYSTRKLSFGAAVQNVMNNFAWDESKLYSKKGTGLFDGNTDTTDFADQPYANAPTALRQRVTDDKFKPVVAAGIAYAVNSVTTFSADARSQIGDGIVVGPKTQVGGGLEFRGIPLLPLRVGASYVTGGWGVSGGIGLKLAGYELGVGAALRTINGGKEPAITVNAISIR
ncbi:MAG TPA: hypothetical protein VHB25_21830 [Gemmatimonadaceae bacterium]|nr:hypothetical protein [Gemmatimonadaceae bacterium]